MIPGHDLLGLGHKKFPVQRCINLIPAGNAIGYFDDPQNTFDDPMKNLKKLMASDKYTVFRAQFHYSSKHDLISMDKLKRILLRYHKLSTDNPHLKFYLSHSCEHQNPNKSEVRRRMEMIGELAPKCIPVNSVIKNGALLDGYINEKHGDTTVNQGWIVSHDGTNCYDIDMESWKERNKAALIQFMWAYPYNLREIGDPGQAPPPPDNRTRIPTKQDMESIIRLQSPIGEAPPWEGPGRAKKITQKEIFKTHAEDSQGASDPREQRPVWIVGEKVNFFEIVTFENKIVGKLMYGGTFSGGRYRYYAGLPGGIKLYGYEIGRKAHALSGSEFVFLKGKSVWGPINPAFRAGSWR